MSFVLQAVDKALVVIVPSFNNVRWCQKNLGSIFMQKYNNYRVIYVDDCSNDGQHAAVCKYVNESGQQNKVTIVRNNERKKATFNIYYAVHMCNNNEIAMVLDGDDWLAHDMVFSTINQTYQDPNIWLAYTQHIRTDGVMGICEKVPDGVIQQNGFRQYKWVTSAMRTFYVKLFKKIKKEDFLINGEFFSMTSDQAYMYPMLEMAGRHQVFIDQVLYIYNRDNPINDGKVNASLAGYYEGLIRQRAPYRPLTQEEFDRL